MAPLTDPAADQPVAERLAELARPAGDRWRPPRVLSLADADDRAELTALLDSGTVSRFHPMSEETITEFAEMRRPVKLHDDARQAYAEQMRGRLPDYGSYVAFDDFHGGWEIVHYPPEDDYLDLLHWRHQGRIPLDWRSRQYTGVTALVAGLSVGSSIALSLARTGVARRFVIADHDVLSLSNLGRTPYDVRDVGVRKAYIAADRMYRINPYLDISILDAGYTRDDESALAEVAPTFIVEEVDDPEAKALLEGFALDHRIPVFTVADMQNAVLEVRRHDTETTEPFGGRISRADFERLRSGDVDDAAKLKAMVSIVGKRTVLADSELLESFADPTSGGFPQLNEIVAAGAALTTSAIVAVLTGRGPSSGRYTYSPNKVLRIRHRYSFARRVSIARTFIRSMKQQ